MTPWWTIVAMSALGALPEHEERLDFIGFSQTEDAAAWQVRVTRPTEAGGFDRYTVIRVIDLRSGEVIGHIRQGKARRVDSLGRKERLAPPERIESENPLWQDALPARTWKKARRTIRFEKKPVAVKGGAIRFVPDGDAFMTLAVDEHDLRAVSDPGSPIGLTPRARLFDGTDLDLGHIRVAGVANRVVEATVRLYHSPTGRSVAYEVELHSSTPGHERHMEYGKTLRLPRSRLGVTTIGTWNVLSGNFEEQEETFGELHPELRSMFKAYVGRWDF